MNERFLTLVPYARQPVEVELDHWFRRADERYAIVYTTNDHGDLSFHVRLEKDLTALPDE